MIKHTRNIQKSQRWMEFLACFDPLWCLILYYNPGFSTFNQPLKNVSIAWQMLKTLDSFLRTRKTNQGHLSSYTSDHSSSLLLISLHLHKASKVSHGTFLSVPVPMMPTLLPCKVFPNGAVHFDSINAPNPLERNSLVSWFIAKMPIIVPCNPKFPMRAFRYDLVIFRFLSVSVTSEIWVERLDKCREKLDKSIWICPFLAPASSIP